MTAPRVEEIPGVRRRRVLRRLREVPVLPSLVTLGNLFCGFLAIAKVADALRLARPGEPFDTVAPLFASAAVLIFVAMILDALDGRVARMTGQMTPFGAQLDSMADMVTFGVAPAFLGKVLVDWHAQTDPNSLLPIHPKLYYAAAAVYVACAALRLARFNVETGLDEEDHREFRGLPSPAAAAVVTALIALFCTRNDPDAELGRIVLGPVQFDAIVVAMPAVLVLLGLSMVSRVPYTHAMNTLFKKRHSMPFLSALVVLLIVAAIEWQFALAVCAVSYLLSGLVIGTYRALMRHKSEDEEELFDDTPPRSPPGRN